MKIMTADEMRAAPDWMGYGSIVSPLKRSHERMTEAIVARPISARMPGSVPWQKSEDETLRRLNAIRCPCTQIAEVLTRSKKAVSGRALKLGISFKGPRRIRLPDAQVKAAMGAGR